MSQRRLFDAEPEPWQQDDEGEQLVASVVLPSGPAQLFDYFVPDRLREQIEPGRRVRAPLGRGNRLVVGYCVRLQTRPTGRRPLKAIEAVVDSRTLLKPAMLRMTEWIADRYLCDWGQVLETVLPAGVRLQAGTRLTTLLRPADDARERIAAGKLPEKQLAVMKALTAGAEPMTPRELARAARCTAAPIDSLRRKGFIIARAGRIECRREAGPPAGKRQASLTLNPDQKSALDVILAAVRAKEHKTILIHGVTGSGKTEVYLQAIAEVVGYGRQAIVLVPEISLTPQTVERFRLRFGEVAVLHSHLSDAERHWHWQRIAAGGAPVVVGARSAVFAPTPNLGLIVLDEEHEGSFKQETAPRYHTRDVAAYRAAAERAPLVLGSATPSLESWIHAARGEFTLVEMPRRVMNRPMPLVGAVDLRIDLRRRATTSAVSRPLRQAIAAALADDGQVMLLLNRRGYSTHIQCPACGLVMRCPDCDIALTHHRTEDIALCHYCDYQTPAPTVCPECEFAGINFRGYGTQRLEAELRRSFPDVPCLRMDTDTMRRPGSHERAFADFRAGKVKILLGTQMIAKGLDFPNVTLVGVINADTALHLPDFRAAERTFQLVTQVAGRTGRGPKGGRVLVQTFNPDHAAIRAAVRHDFAAFAAGELPLREMFRYPPFASMIRLVIRGPVEAEAAALAEQLAEGLRGVLGAEQAGVRVLGPAPAPFARLRGKFRFQIQMQGPDGAALRKAVRQAAAALRVPKDVQWMADVDPLDML